MEVNNISLDAETKKYLKLKKEDVTAMSEDEFKIAFAAVLDGIAQAEKKGYYSTAQQLRKKLDLFEGTNELRVEGGIEDVKRQDWEYNHLRIKRYIHNFVMENNGLPGVSKIAEVVGLSRQSVHKHLSEGLANSFHRERLKTFEYLVTDVLTMLYSGAITGNVAAAKVYLDNVLKVGSQPPAIKNQNNFVQINNTKIDEVTINQLPQEAREKIESILTQYKQSA